MTQLADSVAFETEGARRTLRLTPGAWIELEDAELGDINTLAQSLAAKPSFKVFVAVFAAALRGGEPEANVSNDEALALANKLGSAETIALVTKAVEVAFPATTAAGGNGKNPKPAK